MSKLQLSSSPLTKGPTDILRTFEIVEDEMYHTGIDIAPSDRTHYFPVYSACAGIVTYVGRDAKFYTIIVEYDPSIAFRYYRMKSVEVSRGQAIEGNIVLGQADLFLHFELCERVDQSEDIELPLYAYSNKYTRVDAMDVVSGKRTFFMATDAEMLEVQVSEEEDTLEYRLTQEEYFQKLYVSVDDLPQYNNYLYPEISDD